jgi:hypothetical protein
VHAALLASKNKWLGIDAVKYVENIAKEISREKTEEVATEQVFQTQTIIPENKYIALFRSRL